MATIHFILQGKGGVGKSMIAVMLYQALERMGQNVSAFDTDPVNSTLASFEEFKVSALNVMRDGNIDPRKYDELLEALVNAPAESHVIVDNGASSFIALGAYLQENDFLSILKEYNHRVFFHSIVTGGQMLGDTVNGLSKLAINFPDAPIVVWLNPYFGDVEMDGRSFDEFKISKDFGSQFHVVIDLPRVNNSLTGRDLEEVLAKRQSFAAAMNSSSTKVGVRSRLRHYWEDMFSRIEQAGLTEAADA